LRILVVEDDARIADPVAAALRDQHHTVDIAPEGETGLELCDTVEYDMVVLDLMLPGLSGIDVCRTMRKRGSRAMVLMMTARDSVRDKVAALDEGADDYLVKPFELGELLARTRALSRRGTDSRRALLKHGPLEFDQTTTQVRYDGRQLELTRTEYVILETLLLHPSRVFSSDFLYGRVEGFEGVGTSATIKSHIANLRKKFRVAGARSEVIITLYGFGYRLADP